jgi:ABC-2 type transport system permease protein
MSTGRLPVVNIRPTIWYNPELKSMYFLIPGIIGIIIMVIGAIRMSISLVKEKESGTIESILVSPLRPVELMIGKIVPYVVIVFADLLIIVVFSVYVFDVPFRGSVALFLSLSLVFLAAALGTGLFVSAVSQTSQVAWLLGFLLTILPSILLSGFIFPIESMPRPIQAITLMLPVRYFLTILRGIILKGVGLDVLYPQALVLVLFAGITVAVSSSIFRKRF